MNFKANQIFIALAVIGLAYWAYQDMKKKEKGATADTPANLRIIQDTPVYQN